jgi:predicted PurR-regulated permease PerM
VEEERGRLLAHPLVARVARWGIVAWSLIGVGYLALLIYRYLLYPLHIVFPPLLLATVIVYLLNPLVSRLERRGVGRVWGSLLTYLVFLGLLAVGLRYLVPIVANQVTGFATSVPDLLERTQAWLADLNRRLNFDFDTNALVGSFSPEGGGGAFISRIFSFTVGILSAAVAVILGLVLGFYLLVDLPKIQRGAMALIPAKRRPAILSILERMGKALGGYFRGQLLVALFVGLASMLGLYIVGLPYWALVGMVAGLFNLIPLLGPFIGGIPALFIAFTANEPLDLPLSLNLDTGWPLAIGSVVALLAVQQIDNHIISPNIVARTVKLHPVTVMLGLLVAGTLLGLWGMLLAVPVIATAKILVLHYWDTSTQWPPTRPEAESGAAPVPPTRTPSGPLTPAPPDEAPAAAEPEPARRPMRTGLRARVRGFGSPRG